MQWTDTTNEADFRRQATQWLEEQMRRAIEERERCVLGLSGGSTPKVIYLELGKSEKIDWQKVWIFLVDDRHITPNHPDSNQYLIHTTLCATDRVSIDHLIFPDPTLPHEECAKDYARRLEPILGKGKAADIVTLGMGDDGHIASLFPPVPEQGFGPALTIATTTDHFAVPQRISVTMPVLTNAHARLFLLKGEGKRLTWNDMMESKKDRRRWPAKGLLDERTTVLFAA
jgi:6-phosphogluconolactonase